MMHVPHIAELCDAVSDLDEHIDNGYPRSDNRELHRLMAKVYAAKEKMRKTKDTR